MKKLSEMPEIVAAEKKLHDLYADETAAKARLQALEARAKTINKSDVRADIRLQALALLGQKDDALAEEVSVPAELEKQRLELAILQDAISLQKKEVATLTEKLGRQMVEESQPGYRKLMKRHLELTVLLARSNEEITAFLDQFLEQGIATTGALPAMHDTTPGQDLADYGSPICQRVREFIRLGFITRDDPLLKNVNATAGKIG